MKVTRDRPPSKAAISKSQLAEAKAIVATWPNADKGFDSHVSAVMWVNQFTPEQAIRAIIEDSKDLV